MTEPAGLAALEAELSRQFTLLNLPPKPWMPETPGPDGAAVLDVAIIGAGLCGLVAHAALAMEGIGNTRLFDRAPEGREGPWITYARMETLRTVKEAAGPALGVPALTFRAWFEAQWGAEAWDDMTLAPREMWMDYLIWYRRMTRADVLNDCDVTEILPEGRLFRLSTSQGTQYARRVVIATGLDALGAPQLPAVARELPRGRVYHSADMFDPATLRVRHEDAEGQTRRRGRRRSIGDGQRGGGAGGRLRPAGPAGAASETARHRQIHRHRLARDDRGLCRAA